MKRILLSVIALITTLSLSAQSSVSRRLSTDTFENRLVAEYEKHNYQGMDCCRNYVISLQHSGIATIWKYVGKNGLERVSGFNLAVNDPVNHSNVASFGVEKYDRKDPLPLLYVSQCHRSPYQGRKDVLFVMRITPDLKGSELVQTIFFDDTQKLFGYALQWVIDRKAGMLYGYGNTTEDKDVENNRHRVVKFRLPKLSESDPNGLVTLTNDDLLENYVLEDYGLTFSTIGQGLCISKGRLIMPTGLGTVKYPSYLFVWDLSSRKVLDVLDMSIGTTGELEDAAWYKGKRFLIQGQDGLFEMKYPK